MRTSIRPHHKARLSPYFLKRLSSWLVLSSVLTLGITDRARGAAVAWEGDTGGTPGDGTSWSDANNWSGDTLPSASAPGDDLTFGTGTVGTINLGGNRIANSITFNSGFSLGALATTDQLTITTGVVTAGAAATINAVIVGSSGLTLSATSTDVLTLTADNSATLTGTVQVNGGTLSISSDNNFGTATNGIVLNGGTLQQTLAGQVSLGASRTLTIGAGNGTIDVTNIGPTGKLLLAGAGQLVGSGTITKIGAGDFQISSANTGFTGTVNVTGGQLELQNAQALGTVAPTITVGGTGEVVVTSSGVSNWTGGIIANAGGTLSGNGGTRVTYSGPITANGQFIAHARFFQTPTTPIALVLAGQITGSGGLVAQGALGATGRVLITGNNNATWTGNLQVDPNTQAVATVGFGGGAANSLPTGDLTLNGGRLTITPSIGTGLVTTAGLVGRWISQGSNAIQNTYASPWFTVPTAATRTDAVIDNPNVAGISTTNGLPGGFPGYLPVPQGVGAAATTAFIDSYAVAYNGLLNIVNGGSYTFTMPSDDGSSVFIDGQQVLANEGGHGTGTVGTGTVPLASGLHQITVKNTNGGTGGGLQLAYQGPDQLTAPVFGTINGNSGITNMATVGVPATALSNVTGGLSSTITNTITAPDFTGTSVLEAAGLDVTSSGAMSIGQFDTLIFASATSHSWTQNGPVALGSGATISSAGTAVTAPVTTTLAPANVIINGAVTLGGNVNMNVDGGVVNNAIGLMTINSIISDAGGGFGITKGGGGTLVLAGAGANTFGGALTVNQGTVLLSKTTGVDAVSVGGIVINASAGVAGVDQAVVRLTASNEIPDAAPVTIGTIGSFGGRLDLNGFSDTVGAITISSTTGNSAAITTGATGILTLGGDITFNNNRAATGNTGREVLITGNNTAATFPGTQTPGVGTLNLGGVARTITVNTINAPTLDAGSDATIETVITNGSIIKQGTQRLILNGSNPVIGGNSTFAGGITVNNGLIRGVGANGQTSSAFGAGAITLNIGLPTETSAPGVIELRNNGAGINTGQGGTVGAVLVGQSVANRTNYGNSVIVNGSLATVGMDVNNNNVTINGNTPTGSGGQLRLGTLNTTATLQLNVTGGNNYALAFNGISLGGALSLNPTTANVQFDNLSGGNNLATIIGATGNVIIGGNGTGFSGNVSVAAGGTLRLAPIVGVVNNLFGGGTFTTAANPTIGISPVLFGGALSAGIPGGLTAKFYQINAAQAINTTTAFATVPSGVLTLALAADGAITNRPPTVTGTSFTNDVVVLSGYINITTPGNYTFQTYVDDESQLVIDGAPVISVNTGGGGTGIIHSPVSAPLNLAAGAHTVSLKILNQGGGGGYGLFYNGPDSGSVMRPIPAAALQSAGLLTNVANSGINQTIAAAGSLTLDGGGTDLDGGINNLTFSGATGTLNVTNVGGTGITTVSGTTAVGANTATLNPTTGNLGLVGDVTGGGVISKTGAGMLILAGAKSFTGAINVTAGSVQVTTAGSLGTTAGATVVSGGAVLDLNGVAIGAEPLTLIGAGIANVSPAALWNSASGAASASGNITLSTTAPVVGGLGDITLSGVISGAVAWSKIGPDTLTLSNSNNSFTTALTVSQGVLKLGAAASGANSPLGTVAGATIVSSGAVLDLNGITLGIAEPLTLNGAGLTNYGSINTLGALINTGGAATFTGPITLGAAASIGSNSLGAGGNITLSGVIGGAFGLTKVGGNTVTLTGASSAVTSTTVNLGTLILSGSGTDSGGGWTVNPTATVLLDNTATAVSSRMGARAITLVGGNLTINGFNGATAILEAMGASTLTFTSHTGILSLVPNLTLGTNGGVQLTTSNTISRASNGTGLVRGNLLGSAAPGVNVANVVSTNGTPLTLTGQGGGASTANRGIAPWLLVDASSTGVGTSFATHVATNGLQVLGAADYAAANTIPTMTGLSTGNVSIANLLLNGGATTNALAGINMSNSLTMDGGATLSIGAGNSVVLDSGGILARDGFTSTISGAGFINGLNLPATAFTFVPTNGPQATTARELIVQTPGAAVLNLNAPIGNSNSLLDSNAGLTKAGSGTLSLGAQEFYTGSTRLNGGTTILNSGQTNTLFFPVTIAPVPGATVSTLGNGLGNLVMNQGTLDLNGKDQRIGGLGSNITAGSSGLPGIGGGVITNNSTLTDATLYISQGSTFTDANSINASAVVGAKKLNLQRDGGNTITLTSANTYTGTTVLNGGVLSLQDGATLSGTSSITVNRAVLKQDESQLQTTANRIPTTIPIALNGGALTFVGRGGGTQNVFNVATGVGGSLTIGLGNALLQTTMAGNANANGAGQAIVNIGNIIRGGAGSQLSFNFIQSNNQNVGDNPRYYVSQLNGGALPAPGVMLPAWITVGGYNPDSQAGGTSGTINSITSNTTDFAQYDPATGIRPLTYTSVIAPGNNVNLGQTTTLPVGGAIINSLRFDGASTLIFGDAGYDTLNLQSGGLITAFNSNSARSIGITTNAGKLTAGGINPGAPQELFIDNGVNTLTINAKIIDNPTDGSVVSPVFSSIGFGATIQLNGSNTYTGTTYANGIILTLNAQAGALAIPGNLIMSGNTSNGGDSQNPANQTTRLLASNQIAPTATVTLNGGTVLDLNGFSNTLNNLVFAADGGSFNNQGPAVQTGAGVLTLNGNVTVTNLLQATTIPSMQGNLSLAAGTHTFNIGTYLAAPGQVGFALNSTLSGSGNISKTGNGILGIGGNSPTYTGTITVTAGSIQFTQNAATGSFVNNLLTNAAVNLGAAGVLNAGGFNGTIGTLTGTGTVTSSAGGLIVPSQIINNITVVPQVNVGIDGNTGTFAGLITGSLIMGKVGGGGASFSNPLNDYTGGTLINGGTFTLAGVGLNTTGSGLVSVNSTGNLAGSGTINGGIQFNTGSAAAFNLGAPFGAAPIITPASVNSSGAATFNITGTTGVGTYSLIDYAGSAITTNQMAGMKLGTTPGGGLLYGLVNNVANTSIDLVVETAGAASTWTGSLSGLGHDSGNWTGGSPNGLQVTLNNSGANKAITGSLILPQAITVTNSGAGNDYSIANDLGGALAGGLTKNGNGTLRLTGNNTFGGAINVTGGVLRANVTSLQNSLGGGSVALGNATTLMLDPVADTSVNGLTGRVVTGGLNTGGNTANDYFGQIALNASTYFAGGTTNITGGTNSFYPNGVVNNFAAQFTGKVSIPAAGPWSFYTRTDDGSRVFVDGVLIVNNDGGKGQFGAGNAVMLSQGLHDIRVDFGQGTGGDDISIQWQGPGVAKAFIPATNIFTAESVTSTGTSSLVNVGTNVSVSGSATLNLNGSTFTGVQLGTLVSPGASTLNVTGNDGKLARFAGTSLSGGTVTYNASADLALGQVTDGGTATTIIKQGSGRLVLDDTNFGYTGRASSLASSTIIEVQGGKLVAQGYIGGANPLSAAQVRLNGGGLLLDTKQNGTTFDNAVSVLQNAVIEVQPSGLTQTLGSGTNGIAISGGSNLTFDLYGGARTNGSGQAQAIGVQGASLTVAGAITGTGNLVFRSTQFDQGMYPVYGSATFTNNNTVAGTVTLTGGIGAQNVVTTMPLTLNSNGRLAGATGITLNAAQLTVDDSATINSGRLNITTAVPVTLNMGNLNILASTGTVNSGETIAGVTLNSGLNRLVIQNTPGTGVNGLLTASTLTRNNRSVLELQGVGLGGTANTVTTAVDLIKFTDTSVAFTGQFLGGAGVAATATMSVLPYGVGTANPQTNPSIYMPVTYDTTNGMRPINTTTEITTTAAAVPSANVRDSVSAATSPVPTGNAINTWTLDNSAAAAVTTTITTNPVLFSPTGAGLLLLTASNATQSAHTLGATIAVGINFQGAEGNIIVTDTAGATINTGIAGTNGLTLSGNNNINSNSLQAPIFGGSLTLSADNSATLAGTITINGRVVINNAATDTPLGAAANPIQFGGGTLVFNNANTTLASAHVVTMLPNSFGVIDTNGNANFINGQITGSGGLVKINTGRLTLASVASNYSGTTTVLQGDLTTTTGPQGNIILSGAVDNGTPASATPSNLTFTQLASGTYTGNISGIGSVTINVTNPNQTITLGDPTNAAIGVNTYAGGTTISSANTTLRGTTTSLVGGIATGAVGNFVTYDQTFDGTAKTVVTGAGAVIKQGSGKVSLINTSSYTNGTSIIAGTLNINADATLGAAAGTVAISNDATLQAAADITTNRAITVSTVAGGNIDTNGNTVTLDVGSSVAGTLLEKTGTGKLNINGAQSETTLTTTAGTTNVNTAVGTGSSTVNANATTNIGASQTLAALNIGAGAVVTFGDGPFSFGFADEPAFTPSAGPSLASAAVVPEPGTVGLLLVGVLGLAARRRRS